MPDISMCDTEDCPNKITCYRYVAIPDKYQSFFAADPREPDGSCTNFWDIKLPKKAKNVKRKKS